MNSILEKTKNWYSENSWAVKVFLAFSSISLSHYVGFIVDLPTGIVAASGGSLVAGVTSIFIFYLTFSVIFAKVFTAILQPFLFPLYILISRLLLGLKLTGLRKRKKFVRDYNGFVNTESYTLLTMQVVLATIIMGILYLEPPTNKKSAIVVLSALLILLTVFLFRARFFLLCNPRLFFNRIRKREKDKSIAITGVIVTLITFSIVASFFIGSMRMTLLKKNKPQQITNSYFRGYANLLASSGLSALIYEKRNNEYRYMYITNDYALAVESNPNIFTELKR